MLLLQTPAPARPHTVVGRLDILPLASKVLGNTRSIRVWFPPRFDAKKASHYPVLVMHDGQNLFDGATSFIPGGEWRVDETATMLIEAKLIPELVIIGVDNGGGSRGDEYLPTRFKFRSSEIGGRADLYLQMLTDELFPMLKTKYGLNTARFGMAGSSFGGVITLYAASRFGARVDRMAVVSPSVWVNNREPLGWVPRIARSTRVWVDIGGSEGEEAVSGARLLSDAFVKAGHRPTFAVEPNAEHNEFAWARRFPAILLFLYGK